MTHADVRGRSEQPGIVSRHCFSSGPYYDPDRMSFGPIIGVDEHTVAPGAGFDWHAHRDVRIVSVVLEGTLRHKDSSGVVRTVAPGTVLVQATGSGTIRHTETNASDDDPLRFVQITVTGGEQQEVSSERLPATVAGIVVDVRSDFVANPPCAVLVLDGSYAAGPDGPIPPGAFFTVDEPRDTAVERLTDDARVLVLELGGGRRPSVEA